MNSTQKFSSTQVLPAPSTKINSIANNVLNGMTHFWFVVAVIGQWIFAFYVAVFYGGSAIGGNFERWNRVLPHGYEKGNLSGNLFLAFHLFFAVVILIGGPLQFIPLIRKRIPVFHRWNGRLYGVVALAMGASGLYLGLSGRKLVGDTPQHIGILINGILILLFAILAWRFAVKRKFTIHRQWTLRLFMVVNGVWFFRVGLMFWIFINKGPVGFDPNSFTGPFLSFLSFAQYLLPLVMLEFYLLTERRGGFRGRFAMAALLFLFTLVMGYGIFAATLGMWMPRIQ